ncbi:MAG: glycosyltransferase family 2 protein [Methanoregulaceae archaeon]|nr:glycosyltransferase family 2 protein [Methanoregulaceae archaeon]
MAKISTDLLSQMTGTTSASITTGSIRTSGTDRRVNPVFSLIIPAYNEEGRIASLLDSLPDQDGEYIIVCDGTDRTADLVERFATLHPELSIRCLRYTRRLGKGGGVREGLKAASAPRVGFMDADCSTSVGDIMRLFTIIGDSDGVIGSRWIEGAELIMPQGLLRRLQSRGFNHLIRLLFRLPYRDTQCGAKVFLKAAIDTVLPCMKSSGFEFDVELLWRLRNAGFIIREVPIRWQNNKDTRVKSVDMIPMVAGLLRVRFGG